MTRAERSAAMRKLRQRLPMRVLIARDRGICGLSGTKVDTTKAGQTSYADLGPTRDHVVPLELGGANNK